MNFLASWKHWWQVQTGESETPMDGDMPAWVVSFGVHVVMMIALAFVTMGKIDDGKSINFVSLPDPPPVEEEVKIELPKEFAVNDLPQEAIGSASPTPGGDPAQSLAPEVADVQVDTPTDLEESPVGTIQLVDSVELPKGLKYGPVAVHGSVGNGTTGAMGAIDRITQEILNSLNERKTLVVWLFDQSASLNRQRSQIHKRFDRIYEELGVIEAAGNKAFKKHEDKPLLTSVVAFGNAVSLETKEPTDNLDEIKRAIAGIKQDDTGVERVFTAIYSAVDKYKTYRVPDEATGEPKRNVMIVVFTDEVGEDQDGLETTIKACRRYGVPTYVVGTPAPFGQRKLMVKWVDPDPKFDQTPGWGEVDQGPETLFPERVKLNFSGMKEEEEPIDSGFGPYALTRLCWETGGIYFSVHPNRNLEKAVTKDQVDPYSSYIKYFFDPAVMRKYRPDYVSPDEQMRRISMNKARQALVAAGRIDPVGRMERPELRFVKTDEAAFSNALSAAQQKAAVLEPQINMMYEALKIGEGDRANETVPRWQAGYDLAMGRVLAVKARTESYNLMLAEAKRGLKPKVDKNNTWTLKPVNKVTVGSAIEKQAKQAHEYLERVIKDHPDTPWALLAKRELEEPIGWEWTESFTDTTPRKEGMGGNGNGAPANDKLNMLNKGPERRPVPKL